MIPLENYKQRLHEISLNRAKFSKFKGIIIGKEFLEGLEYDIFIQHEIQHLFITKPTFEKYSKVDEAYRKVTKFSILDDQRWDKVLELIE